MPARSPFARPNPPRAALCALLLSAALTTPAASWAETAAGTESEARAEAPGGYLATDADQAATLLADRVTLPDRNTLVADGNVVIYYKDSRLDATRVTYDRARDLLTIEGPLRIVPPGQTGSVLLADSAQLSPDLRTGVVLGARMVLARELQLAANRVERPDANTTEMTQVVASSCRICASDPTPLWEIRARKITHDLDAHVLRFEDAQFRIMGAPIAWVPALRMPDPTVERMSGVLRPVFRTTSKLGAGLKLPYFFTLGPSADLTVTPYYATSHTATWGLAYRQALTNGNISLEGAYTRDSVLPGEKRGYLFADGAFKVADGYTLGLQLRAVSDPSYLLDYDITDDDRLWSGVWLERARANELIWMRSGHTHSIRDGESNATQPMTNTDFVWTRVIRPAYVGGEATIDWEAHAHDRSSDLTFDTNDDDDDVSDGRDTIRTSVSVDWRRQALLPGGVLGAALGRVDVDAALTRQDDDWTNGSWSDGVVRALPTLGAELRWPLVATEGKAAQVLEPVAQILWSPDHLKALPNEDSLLTELDEGDLFSFSRFPGGDERELGTRLNLGLDWTRLDAAGWSLGLTAGRIVRLTEADQFPEGSGLSGNQSDWLIGANITTANGLTIANRALFDDQMDFARDELRFGYLQGPYALAAGYIWMKANPTEGRDDAVSELALESRWKWTEGWATKVSTRYDFTAERAAKAAVGLEYANECVSVDLSLSRRFTSSTSVTPETSFGFSVQLAGFGAQTSTGVAGRVCRG